MPVSVCGGGLLLHFRSTYALFNKFISTLCALGFYLHVCIVRVYSLKLELKIVEHHHAGPLEEHPVRLTTELSFQPHIHALVGPFLPFGVLEV